MTVLATPPAHATADAASSGGTARPPGRVRAAVRFTVRRPGLLLSVLVAALVLLAAVAPAVLAGGDPLTGVPAEKLQGPSADHLFGTDQLGRDVFTRVVHGTSLSLRASALAVLVALAAGGSLGLVAGFAGGFVDDAVMRLVDVLQAIPRLLLSLAVITALGFGTTKIALAVGVAAAAVFARVMRAEVLRVRGAGYVEAARASGVRPGAVLLRHVLPNAWGPVLVIAALEFGVSILAVSSLSFLGFGAAPPTPEWGALVADGRNFVATAWWLTTFPGLVVAATVLAANRISRALDTERGDDR
ncbi:ABC transporter permease [Yinghuangia seranimata]|uniref:ABC transporter permease n=1 Tax=Yinghuangia seranimata TaxID=408067 RepID=UPI00248CF609|nr:ABC transporter permease [Yinghuangia seranimata]MDI2132032.1 ABC transporter permease [Yinghuangia seranimata]